MQKGRGRTSRIRRRKHLRSSESRGVNESYKSEFIELKKWLKNRKFEDRNLTPARFPGTGRGLMSRTPLRVKAAFNEKTRCYEIRTASGCRKHEEVFICYGPHDNQRLLLEYGFVSPCNPHACVYVSRDTLVKYLPSTDKQMNKKISILKDHGFIENLTFGWDGPSWRLLTALKLLCLEAEKFTCWKKVLLGEVVSDANEKTSLDVAQKICHHLLEESSAMLQRVSHMKDEKVSLVSQLALVETLWREELMVIQASAETLASVHTTYLASPKRLGSPPVLGVT
ncbi:SET domain-containing protein 4-like [Callospermophilus lateralis]